MAQGEAVRAAYDAVAGSYDQVTGNNNYELWFGELLPKLDELGLRKGALLDVACGTGKAIGPMLDRGWTVTACDISPGMIEQAMEKFPEGVEFAVRDMTELPHLGDFDLVWALNDPVNYLVDDGDLERAFASMGANLGPDGLLVFDCNTLKIFREAFGADDICGAEISGEGVETSVHRERHWPVDVVRAALNTAGLEPLAAIGQREEGDGLVLSPDCDEDRDHKIVHVARRATA